MRPHEFWDGVEAARRLVAPSAGDWRAKADEVWEARPEGKRVCRCQSVWAAEAIAAMHNMFLPMANALLMVRKKAADREAMGKD